jgi:predicted Rossmann-fold nucleotide-binding protein
VYGDRAAIAVLGPSRADAPKAGKAAELAAALGHHLARTGYAVVVEGRGMTAQSVARSARQVGGLVAAVTDSPDQALDVPGVEVLRTGADSVLRGGFAALSRVLELADALILLAGDLRSVTVLTQVWVWGLEPDAPYRQIVLVGDGWPETVRILADAVGLDAKTRAMVTFAREPAEAVEALRYYVAPR